MLSSADESSHGLAVEIPTNHREIPGSTPGRYNLQIEIGFWSWMTGRRRLNGITRGSCAISLDVKPACSALDVWFS